MKFNMEKFAKYFNTLGKHLKARSEELNQTLSSVNSETDLQIFIEENRTADEFHFKPEVFVPYQNSNLDVNKRFKTLVSEMEDE